MGWLLYFLLPVHRNVMQLSAKALCFLGPAFESRVYEVDAGASVTDEGKGLCVLNHH